jgi:hypothetical protein
MVGTDGVLGKVSDPSTRRLWARHGKFCHAIRRIHNTAALKRAGGQVMANLALGQGHSNPGANQELGQIHSPDRTARKERTQRPAVRAAGMVRRLHASTVIQAFASIPS